MNIHILPSVNGTHRGPLVKHLRDEGHNPNSNIKDADFIIGMDNDTELISKVEDKGKRIALTFDLEDENPEFCATFNAVSLRRNSVKVCFLAWFLRQDRMAHA